ncbi:hypothetical protein B0I35DRAFT_474632 [Stachybotrys elegans]|uniref:Dystroglycan-type cadherin-like domain-containing protein n=1 Tax=Stachybotrys elegans TaxID=80388 RepID=A0A8K0T4F1_9HYPO|nr:hypothetical protein B0I35DRAFT_474632 [Stachybotrys elegans]
MDTIIAFFTVLDLVYPASSTPIVTFPINSQLPPVARAGQPFSYSFSQSTFQSNGNISYSLGNHPSWLSIESDQRRLFGTPDELESGSGDVVGQSVEILAADDTGVASHDATLVVSRSAAPSVKIPVEEQIGRFGSFSAPSSILSYPSTDFELSFDSNTFDHQTNMLNYYAASGNNSPLPSWVHFNEATLTFFGKTPPFESLIQPPQIFSFELVASDVVGFSAASVSFSIVVGNHRLTSDESVIKLDAKPGSPLTHDGLTSAIQLDGQQVKPGDLHVTWADFPPWLSFDPSSWILEGKPAKDDTSTNATITFTDEFSDTLEIVVMVVVEEVEEKMFKSRLEDISISPGDELNVDLAGYFTDPDDAEVRIAAEPQQDWLELDGLVLKGKVPETASGNVHILVQASSKSSGIQDTQILGIQFLEKPTLITSLSVSQASTHAPESRTNTQTSLAPTSTATEAPDEANDGGSGNTTILLATLIPILTIAIALLLVICITRRRRARRTDLVTQARLKGGNVTGEGEYYVHGASVHHIEETTVESLPRRGMQRLFTPMKNRYNAMTTRASTASILSDSSGALSAADMPPDFLMGAAGPGMSRGSRSFESRSSGDSRGSWFTMEGSSPRQERNSPGRDRRSSAPALESRRQLLPPPSFLTDSTHTSLSDALDMTVPPLFDLSPSTQPAPVGAYQPQGRVANRESIDGLSTSTSSSAALPRRREYTHSRTKTNSTAILGFGDEEPVEQVAELRPLTRMPAPTRQVSGRKTSTSPHELSPISSDGRGTGSPKPFTSGGNWSTFAPQEDDVSAVYREIVDDAPFHPSRPNTATSAGAGPRRSEGPMPLSGDIQELSLRKQRPGSRRLRAGTEPRESYEGGALTGASQSSFKIFL